MSTELADQLKSAAGHFVFKAVGSLAGVFGLSAYFMIAAPFGRQYGMLAMAATFGLWFVYVLVLHTRKDGSISKDPVARKAVAPTTLSQTTALESALQWLEGHTELSRRDAAQDRPWYLVFGSAASGKTTLISGTGLGIRYPAWGNNPAETRKSQDYGVYVTERGVVLDAPGTFLDGTGLDSLLALLKRVRRLRRREPLNGLLLVLDSRQLMSLTKDQLGRLGLQYRDVLRKMRAAIGRNVPINVAISKCDELPGFAAFFDGLPVVAARTPAWGFALTRAERDDPEWLGHCDRQLRALYARLVARRTVQLRVVDEAARKEAFNFPEQFQMLRDHLRTFIEPLCRRTKSSDQPVLRGLYFTGALGVDSTAALGTARRFTDAARTLMQDVVLANPASGTASWWQEIRAAFDWKMATLASGAVLLALLMGFGVYPAYRDNLRVVQATDRLQQIPDAAIPERIAALSELRTALIAVGADEHFPAIRTHHWTMFAGRGAIDSGVHAYEDGVVKAFISNPMGCASALESALSSPQDDLTLYRALKTYLMISSPGKPRQGESGEQKNRDVVFLSDAESALVGCWTSVATSARADGGDELGFYAHRLVTHENPVLHMPSADANGRIQTARDRLAGADPIQAYYDELRGQSSAGAAGLALPAEAKATALLTSSPNAPIPGLFTRKGWESIAQPRIEVLVEEYRVERQWVLGLTADSEAVRRQLRERYFVEYRNLWMAAIRALKVSNSGNWGAAMGKLLVVSGSQPDSNPSSSAYYQLLKLIADNTWAGSADASAPPEIAALAKEFTSIHGLVNALDGKPADIQEYLSAVYGIYIQVSSYQTVSKCDAGVLNKVRDAVLRSNEVVAKLRPRIDPSLSNVGTLLQQPVTDVNKLLASEQKQCQAPVPGLPPGPPPSTLNPTVTLTAQPSTISPGQSSTLEWTSERATTATLEGAGVDPTRGTRVTSPTQTTTYTIIVTSTNGSKEIATATVTVLPAAPAPPPPPEPIFVSGKLTEGNTADGKPAGGKLLLLRRSDTGAIGRATSGPDGAFRFAEAIEREAQYELCHDEVKAETCSTPAKVLRSGDLFRYQEKKPTRLYIPKRYTARIAVGK